MRDKTGLWMLEIRADSAIKRRFYLDHTEAMNERFRWLMAGFTVALSRV